MKITILVSGFPPECTGGTEIATKNIAEHLATSGHEIHVIFPSYHKFAWNPIYNRVYLHPLKISTAPLSFTYQALQLEHRVKSDIIHAQGIFMGVPALIIKKVLKTPYIVYGRGSDVYTEYHNKSLTYAPILNNANAIIALTEHMKREMQKTTNKSIHVIPNGIDINLFSKSNCLDKNRVLYVGGLREIKGVKYLITAMEDVLASGIDASLTIVGNGKERVKLESLVESLGIKNRVCFMGNVPNSFIPEIMFNHSVFVLPSLSEGFPGVLLEAMATGLPIVTTNINGNPELIESGANGLLVNPGNSHEIASKLSELFNDRELRTRLSNNDLMKSKQYSWDNTISKLEKIYEELI